MQLDPIKTQALGGEKLKSRGMLNLGTKSFDFAGDDFVAAFDS